MKILTALTLGLILISGFAQAQMSLSPKPPAEKPKAAPAPIRSPLVDEARAAVAGTLRDPGSAQYRGLAPRNVTNLRGEPMTVVCGEVNARNGFGGFTGFAPFIYLASTRSAHVLGPDQDVATVVMIRNFCS